MVKRIDLSQFRSQLRQLESKQRQAAARYKQQARTHNEAVRNLKRAVDRYNQEVRSYNSRQRLNQQRRQSGLRRLQSQRATGNTTFHTSVSRLQSAYTRLEVSAATRVLTPTYNYLLDLAEQEAANRAEVVNALLESGAAGETADLQQTMITDEISMISEDLDARWRGAQYALNPANPDAARHFCASSREIFTQIQDIKAPDQAVFAALPDDQRSERGNATRQSKIKLMLLQKGVDLEEMVEFASEDVANDLELFAVLNNGTHGRAGTYDMGALVVIKRRVEDGLRFMARIAA